MTMGIDLGTTYSACATVHEDGVPEILEGESGRLTPSVVFFDGSQPLVGVTAKNMAAVDPGNYVELVKRRMGTRTVVHTDEDDKDYFPEEISAVILRHLAQNASRHLGTEDKDVVVTVPAYFDDAARTATKDAAKIAGLNVKRLINEPTAAGIAYGVAKNKEGTYLVYDLGGGTFDVTVMKVSEAGIDVIATGGNRSLGGFDFDNLLMMRVKEDVEGQGGPDLLDTGALEATLRGSCEEAKRRLTQLSKTTVNTTADGRVYRTPITRDDFESASASLLRRTEDIVEEVLDEAGMSWKDIDDTLLVGGSTRMPMVAAMVERLSGSRPRADANPDEVVAIGAALLAASLDADEAGARRTTPLVSDVTSHGMGMLVQDPHTKQLYNSVIIPKNSKIPCEYRDTFFTVVDRQEKLDFEITEGDSREVEDVEVHHVDTLKLLPGLPEESPIRVTMQYDVDGTIHAEVYDVTNDRPLGDFHLPRPNNMTSDQVAQAVDRLRSMPEEE
ncbi:Hsp70 family protein [Glycomyces buryatensis]|uniref:Hsp70 family protein n=1 Tax=Glycomyces buryatensis TaxID=2570927 RepID=A0A4S8QDJ9_9ACTN|nr:Hsp70 family protein [Glycomyces buryatensis]THV42458.1 Hsp70 family protein [Glycomyces buryatensis]